eukprot:CAMPEP_0178981654 /NCGR_PEP_ID=MMETSP0795-20121207/60_1 /TAXON_ID=88552 /ORGANISM="Amoebophrya sp., Strain Ameob2" /LENGTH=126 /DNA_ID=CAMNT_0020672211 /DNA_START=724 /DNA_END=1100 /DNA_ORIENTATION=-
MTAEFIRNVRGGHPSRYFFRVHACWQPELVCRDFGKVHNCIDHSGLVLLLPRVGHHAGRLAVDRIRKAQQSRMVLGIHSVVSRLFWFAALAFGRDQFPTVALEFLASLTPFLEFFGFNTIFIMSFR